MIEVQDVVAEEVSELSVTKDVEKKFLSAIEKLELTESALRANVEECKKLTINGQDDKTGFDLVSTTRKQQKKLRLNIEAICESGRATAIITQKEWIKLEKKWTEIIKEGELYLKGIEDSYQEEKDRIASEKKRLADANFIHRSTEIAGFGAKLENGYFVLGDLKFEASTIRDADDADYESDIKAAYKKVFDEAEKKRIDDQDRLARAEKMEKVIFNSRFPQLDDVYLNLELKVVMHGEDAIASFSDLIQMDEEEFDKFRDRHNKSVRDRKWALEQIEIHKKNLKSRIEDLYEIGMKSVGSLYSYEDIKVDQTQVELVSQEQWPAILESWKEGIRIRKEAAQKLIDDQIEEARKKQEKETLGQVRLSAMTAIGFGGVLSKEELSELTNHDWDAMHVKYQSQYKEKIEKDIADKKELEEKEKKARQEEEDAAKSDKQKWVAFAELISSLPIPEFKSRVFRKKAAIAKEKFEEIKEL